MKQIILTGLLLVFSLFLFAQETIKALHVGDRVPNTFWTMPRKFMVGGKVVPGDLSKFKGKLLIIDFWATFCIPCIKGMPEQERLARLFGESLIS
ncbi:hypothetical protein [Pedobacter sp. P26]|uniref:hypothetical protein n=1 Tax=Pedobacter sp. P26 TaxID=3423956 RepID=UPI003D66A5B0